MVTKFTIERALFLTPIILEFWIFKGQCVNCAKKHRLSQTLFMFVNVRHINTRTSTHFRSTLDKMLLRQLGVDSLLSTHNLSQTMISGLRKYHLFAIKQAIFFGHQCKNLTKIPHISKGLSDFKQNGALENTLFLDEVFNAFAWGVFLVPAADTTE